MKMQLQFVFQHVITETTTSCNENVVVVCLPTCDHRNDNKLHESSCSLSSNMLSQKRLHHRSQKRQQVAMKCSCSLSSNMLSQKRQQVAMKMQLQSSNMLSQKRQQVAMKMQLQFVFQHVHRNDNKLQCKCTCSLSSNMLSQKRQQVAMKSCSLSSNMFSQKRQQVQLQFVFQHVITETTTSCNENVVVVCLPTCYHRNDNKLQ